MGGWGRRGFGHALEACKNFLSTAVSGGSRGPAGWGDPQQRAEQQGPCGVVVRAGAVWGCGRWGEGEACKNFLSTAVSGGSKGAVRGGGGEGGGGLGTHLRPVRTFQ